MEFPLFWSASGGARYEGCRGFGFYILGPAVRMTGVGSKVWKVV